MIPEAHEQLTLRLWPDAANALGIGRNTAYAAAKRGEIPTIRCGRQYRVPTAAFRRLLGLDEPHDQHL